MLVFCAFFSLDTVTEITNISIFGVIKSSELMIIDKMLQNIFIWSVKYLLFSYLHAVFVVHCTLHLNVFVSVLG